MLIERATQVTAMTRNYPEAELLRSFGATPAVCDAPGRETLVHEIVAACPPTA